MKQSLTFAQLREALHRRSRHDAYAKCKTWTDAQWFRALVGEVGELANVLKKVDRGDFDIMDENVEADIAGELADIQIYLDLLAYKLGVDLGGATAHKFNVVSQRIGSDVRLRFEGQQAPSCRACAHSGIEPDSPTLICGHPDAGVFGQHIWKEPLDHCPGYSKFKQHPRRNADGSLPSWDGDTDAQDIQRLKEWRDDYHARIDQTNPDDSNHDVAAWLSRCIAALEQQRR